MSRLSPDEVILGLLEVSPSHGYELLERFRNPAQLGRIWNMSTSQIYAVLKRLESEGAITGQPVPQLDAPPRMEYHITTQGRDRLAAWLADPQPPVSIHRIRVVFLSRLYIAALLGLPSEGIIERQFSVCEIQLEKIQANIQSSNSPVEILTLQFVAGQLEAAINWLQACEEFPLVTLTQVATQPPEQ